MVSLSSLLGDMTEEDYIYLDKFGNPQQLIDVYAHWTCSLNSSVIVKVSKNETLSFLKLKISEAFEQFSSLRGLSGFSVKSLKMNNKELPLRGKVGEYIRSGNHLYCDFTSEEQWVDVRVNCLDEQLSIYFSIKIKRSANIHLLQKMCCECVLEILKQNEGKPDSEYSFIVKKVAEKTKDGTPPDIKNKAVNLVSLKMEDTVEDHFDYINRVVICTLSSNKLAQETMRSSIDNFQSVNLPFLIKNLEIERVSNFHAYPLVSQPVSSKKCLECSLI